MLNYKIFALKSTCYGYIKTYFDDKSNIEFFYHKKLRSIFKNFRIFDKKLTIIKYKCKWPKNCFGMLDKVQAVFAILLMPPI